MEIRGIEKPSVKEKLSFAEDPDKEEKKIVANEDKDSKTKQDQSQNQSGFNFSKETIEKATKKISELEEVLNQPDIDECKHLTVQFNLMVENLTLVLAKEEVTKNQIQSQPYTETSLMRIIMLLDQLVSLTGSQAQGFEVLK